MDKKYESIIFGIVFIFFISLSIFLASPLVSASSWWNLSWQYRKPLHVSQTGNTTLTNIPILVNGVLYIDTASLIAAGKMESDCKDIRFINASDDAELDFEFTNHSESAHGCNTSTTSIFVELDYLPSSSTTVYMYYGNLLADFADNPQAVWREFEEVFHFDEGIGTKTYGIFGNEGNFYKTNFTDGKIVYGITTDNASTVVTSFTPSYSGTDNFTYMVWFNNTGRTSPFPENQRIISESRGDNSLEIYSLYATGAVCCVIHSTSATTETCGGSGYNDSKWHMAACVRNTATDQLYVYVDGVLLNNQTDITASINPLNITLGRTNLPAFKDGLFGEIDDLYILNKSVNADYIKRFYELGLSYFGAEELIENQPPSIDIPTITPAFAYTDSTLNCSTNVYDADLDLITVNFTWYNDTVFYSSTELYNLTNGSLVSNSLPSGVQAKGEIWNCSIRAYDGTIYSNYTSVTKTILNSIPTHSQPLLQATSPQNTTNDNLTCYNQLTQDADNDAITNIFNWYKNSESLAVLNLPFEINADDYSGDGNDGTIYGAGFVDGKLGKALSFDGKDDYVDLDRTPLSGTVYSVEVWFKMNTVGSYSIFAQRSSTDIDSIMGQLYITYNNTAFITRNDAGGNSALAQGTTVLQSDVWYHAVGVRNGANIYVYLNGVQEGSDNDAGGTITTNTKDIGRWNYGGTPYGYFNGTIDEVRIYDYALSAEQIKQRYEETKDGLTTSSTIVSQETTGSDTFMCQVTPNDGEADGITKNSSNLTVLAGLWQITFNVTDSSLNISLDNVDISCDYADFNQGTDTTNPYGPYGFPEGTWQCTFEQAQYLDKTVIFNADRDKTVPVQMVRYSHLSAEEHLWLEWLYDCWNTGDCRSLLENINQTTTEIWQRVTKTDTSVVANETFISNNLSSTSNITLDYTINVPFKQGYADKDLLPIRMFFWFHNGSTCYNQDKRTDSNRAESPYCFPLIAETLGPNNGSVNFTVDLRPNLTAGIYKVTRAIEIDPVFEGMRQWINYGQEDIGEVTVEEERKESDINLVKKGETIPAKTGLLTGEAVQDIKESLANKDTLILAGMLTFIISLAIICLTIYKIKKINK